MNPPGATDLFIAARRGLLDAMDALAEHRHALVLVGAQAIYLHTGAAPVALAEWTSDSDIAINPRELSDAPLIEVLMRRAGFAQDLVAPQPGGWISRDGIPVDLMVPDQLAGSGSRRSGRIAPHDDLATRRSTGIEAAVVDNRVMTIAALDGNDQRSVEMRVAGPAALLIAKLHKLGERQRAPRRLIDKDAHDVYRLLVATPTESLATTVRQLQADDVAGRITAQALEFLRALFAAGPDAMGARMAGRAEELVGDPPTVSAAASVLAADLLACL